MKRNTKKAFSLIEIMQTVILLGIIAGLSISFFRRIDTDSKLEQSTVPIIKKAVDQTIKDVCNSTVPICVANAPAQCPAGYKHNTVTDTCVSDAQMASAACTLGFINSSGYCETPMLCPCPAANPNWYITGSGVVCGRIVAKDTPCNAGETYAERIEKVAGVDTPIYTCDVAMPVLHNSLQEQACPNGVVNLSYDTRYGYSELCAGLFKYLNHSTITVKDADGNVTMTFPEDTPENIEQAREHICKTANQRFDLTNGVTLINMAMTSSTFNSATPKIIKMDLDRNAGTTSDIKCISITHEGVITQATCP